MRDTRVIYWGMGLNLAGTAVFVMAGVWPHAPGGVAAVVALMAASLIEVLFPCGRVGSPERIL